MAATTNTTTTTTPAMDSPSAEELSAKAANKRYEGLVMVRAKAIKGKGAWYWTHLEPMLVHNTETGLPKAVKLRCSLCDAVFSASNPSRTATEHLKRGTCPNFNSVAKPISSISPTSPVLSSLPPSYSVRQHRNHRKRTSSSAATTPYQVQPLAVVNPSRFLGGGGDHLPASATSSAAATPTSLVTTRQQHQQHLMLSGGKDDLGALAMLEDSVKKLKSPKTSQAPTLSKTQIESAIDYLADWVYETSGSVSFSSLEHPKFKAFLNQVGLPAIRRTEITGSRLDSKYRELKAECEARIRDAMFFQIASDGWKENNNNNLKNYEENMVNLSVNLPNGTSLYRKAVFFTGSCSSKYAEEVLWETITGINGSVPQQCVGIVADKFKSKALKNLENQNHWMVNLSCQYQGFNSLIKDFNKELHLLKNVRGNCVKLASFVNHKSQIRNSFHKYQIQEYGHAWLLRAPPPPPSSSRSEFSKDFNLRLVYIMMEDILSSSRALQLILIDESFKLLSMEDPTVRDIENMIRDASFWNELEAMYSLVKLVKDMAHEIERERPLVGQCLPLWDELRARVKNWSSKFHNIAEEEKESVNNVIERRFNKNYHPAWAAAYILDPLYLVRDTSDKYLPPFKCLTPEQEKDVNKLIARLVSGDEAHIALMELMKWRTQGLDPVYARAVQMKERDPITGKMRIANPQSSRLVWETYLTEFNSLGKIAVRLIFLHATSCGIKFNNFSLLRWVSGHGRRSRIALDRAQKIMFIAAHSKLERRDFSSDEDKEAEVFLSLQNGEDDVLNEVLVDTSSV
ncbi:hypothetical protein K1719_045541 [Acacia pycnantha]|nr:hypothetical protein K1719_045541 [Acacia pycnantha]